MDYKAYLMENVIPFWLKNSIDSELGGIYLYLDEKGKLYGDEKGVWFQGRALYTLSRAYNTIEKRTEYLKAAEVIYGFLKKCRHDDGRLGFKVSRDGRTIAMNDFDYSEMFAAIGCAEYFLASGNEEAAEYAKQCGIEKIAFEMHPGFCVYNPATLLKLREAVGDIIGANFDPSHLIWQGIDPVYAIRALKGAIYHFHAKDTKIDAINTKTNGVLDTKSYADEINRSWIFRSVGYGNDYAYWKDMISALRLCGYDGVISIEHEDSLMTPDEGLIKAMDFLKDVLIYESKGDMWWI